MTLPAAERSQAYANFAAAFSYPGPETVDAIRQGELASSFRQLVAGSDASIAAGIDWSALARTDMDLAALQEEFTRLFEVGDGGPPCPLIESHYLGSELQTFEDLVRYYDYFGLALPDDRQVRPDHLVTELEFLHYLSFHEAQAGMDAETAVALARGQRDFITRHTGAWVPRFDTALAAQGPMPYYRELTRLLARFLDVDAQRLSMRVQQP